jgi:hypothetical protein
MIDAKFGILPLMEGVWETSGRWKVKAQILP